MNIFVQSALRNVIIFYIHLIYLVPVFSKTTCQENIDCNPSDEVVCSMCAADSSSNLTYCLYPFPFMFEEGKSCTQTEKCQDDCSNRGICNVERNKIPFCRCKKPFYGNACQNEGPEEPFHEVIEVSWDFLSQVFINDYFHPSITVVYFSSNDIDLASGIMITTDIDSITKSVTFAGKYKQEDIQCIETEKVCYYNPRMDTKSTKSIGVLNLPFKAYSKNQNDQVFTIGNNVIGYLANYSVNVNIFGKLSYTNTYKIFVSYDNAFLQCAPILNLLNCASNILSPSLISRSTHQVIEISVSYIEDGSYISTSNPMPKCAINSNYRWTLIKHSIAGSKQIKTVYNKNIFELNPYSLEIGLYIVQFNVKTVNINGYSSTAAYCFFRITHSPLEAVIDGGNDRMVYRDYGVILSAKRSRDPNQRPKNQDHVFLQWSCTRLDKPLEKDHLCSARKVKVNDVYIINEEELSYGAVYNFTLMVGVEPADMYKDCDNCDTEPKYAFVRVEVSGKNDNIPNLVIICVKNCNSLVLVNRKLFLKASLVYSDTESPIYKWSFLKGNQGEEFKLENVIEGLPSNMLLVKEDTFEEGTEYTIIVKDKNTELFAKYTFTTEAMIYDEKCEVTPMAGIKGETFFDIVCALPKSGSFIYEFYDKNETEAKENVIFNGRMLGTTCSGIMQQVMLTQGTVCIYIINNNGINRQQIIQILLTENEVTEQYTLEVKNKLIKAADEGYTSNTLRLISSIAGITPDKYKKEVFDIIMNHITNIPLISFDIIKLCVSTLLNVLHTLNKPKQLNVEQEIIASTSKLIYEMSKSINIRVRGRVHYRHVAPKETGLLSSALLDCLKMTLMFKDSHLNGVDEDELELRVFYQLRDSSVYVEDTIEEVKDIMTYLVAPGEPPTKLVCGDGAFEVTVMKNYKEFNLQKLIDTDKSILVKIPDSLQDKLTAIENSRGSLVLQVIKINYNIFRWRKSNVLTNLTSISLGHHKKDKKIIKISEVNPSLKISFEMPDKLNEIKITNNVYQLDPTLDQTYLDLAVKIHRLDPKPKSLIYIKFLFPQTNGSLRVLLIPNFRPDYSFITNSTQTVDISEESPIYPYKHPHIEELTYFFLAILPGKETPINETVEYEFVVRTTLCQHWSTCHWSSSGCQMEHDQENGINCECSHLSIFAAAFPVPPHDIDPYSDIQLFLTVTDNPFVVIFVLTILLLYSLICLCAWLRDKEDRNNKRTVIILEDLFPNDPYPYLMAVYTGYRFNAGTTANVGFQIFGKRSNSRVHILTCKYRKILRKNTDDWFLFFCLEPLGDIISLHIWHDNYGSNPDWFCDKIIVYELKSNVETLFLVEQWLALRLNSYAEANLLPASQLDFQSVKRFFLDNYILGLMHQHILLSIVYIHPRSNISRLQRINLFMVYLMASMLCSIMFYSPREEWTGIDDFQYSIRSIDLIISLQSLIISAIVALVVQFSFRRSHKHVSNQGFLSTIYLRDDTSIMYNNLNSHSKVAARSKHSFKRKKTTYRIFDKFITRLKVQTFAPVQMPGSKPVVEIKRFWLWVSWTICLTTIVVCSFLTMLYGLNTGPVNSKKWLTTVLITIGGDIFLIGPIRIIIFALILAFAFQRMFFVNIHRIGPTDIKPILLPDDEEDLIKLINKRKHPMYSLISQGLRHDVLKKQDLQKQWWKCIDFMISILFVIVVSTVIYWFWTSHYYNNNHIKDVVTYTRAPFLSPTNFFDVKTVTQMDSYLKTTFILALFQVAWYNDQLLIKDEINGINYFCSDYLHKLVGLPMIRQLRVKPETCESLVLGKGKCLSHWMHLNEDTDVYGPRWSEATWYDLNVNESAWKYTSTKPVSHFTLFINRLYGESGVFYGSSGYGTTIGPRLDDAEATLADLRLNNWQDYHTRVLFIELNLFNPNRGLLSQVTLIAEYLMSDTVLLKAKVTSLDTRLKQVELCGLVFVCFIVWYTFRSGYDINRVGLLEYLSGVNNLFRLVIVLIGYLAIAIGLIHLYYASMYFEKFIDSRMDSYFDFDEYSYYYYLTKMVLSVLISFALLGTILYLRFGRIIITQYYMILISYKYILWLSVIGILGINFLLQIAFLLKIPSISRIKELVINKNSIGNISEEDVSKSKVQMFVYLKTMTISVIMSVTLIVFVFNLRIARNYRTKKSDHFNYLYFIFERLKTLITKRDN